VIILPRSWSACPRSCTPPGSPVVSGWPASPPRSTLAPRLMQPSKRYQVEPICR